MDTEQTNFIKQLVLQQLKSHLDSMYKTQVKELWESTTNPKTPTGEEMREDIYNTLSSKSLEEVSQFIMQNTVRKQRGMNGGRKKKEITEEDLQLD